MGRRKDKKIYKKAYTSEEKLKALNLWKRSTIEFVAHRYHCSTRTLYRWKKIYDGTIESLAPKYCPPHTPHPNRHTDIELTNIKNLIRRHPNIGLNELYGKLRQDYSYRRNPVSLYRLLRKNGWYKEVKKKIIHIPQHYETPEQIGVKMQLDVKVVPKRCYVGEYKNDRNFYQYTIIDEATRERYIYAYQEQIATNTIDFLKRAFRFFGYKPEIIQTDNGAEFTYTQQTKHDKKHLLDLFCEHHNIQHKLIKPRTPRHNGKVERSHRNDNERFYKDLSFYSYEDLQVQMSRYLERSNNIPSRVLSSRDKKEIWLTPKQKRKELMLLDWGVVA